MERLGTGIKDLDKEIEGGFPLASAILLIGAAGTGRTTMCNQFLWEGLKHGEAALYILFDAPPEQVEEDMRKFGWNIQGKIVIFIDAYSWRSGGKSSTYTINNLADLNTFNIKVSEAIAELREKNFKRAAIDSISTLFLYVPTDLALRFTSVLIAKLKRANVTHLITVEEGMHDPKVISSLDAITDGKVELKLNSERSMRIVKLRATKHRLEPLGYEITDQGIVITSKVSKFFE